MIVASNTTNGQHRQLVITVGCNSQVGVEFKSIVANNAQQWFGLGPAMRLLEQQTCIERTTKEAGARHYAAAVKGLSQRLWIYGNERICLVSFLIQRL